MALSLFHYLSMPDSTLYWEASALILYSIFAHTLLIFPHPSARFDRNRDLLLYSTRQKTDPQEGTRSLRSPQGK